MSRKDVYDIVTERIVTMLERGTIPWRRPWTSLHVRNLVSGRAYNGVNRFLLSVSGFASPYWLTYKQAQDLDGSVKKGEKGTPVIYWKILEREDKEKGEKVTIPLLRYYTVFNLDQCENVRVPRARETEEVVNDFSPIERCEAIVAGMPNPPAIDHNGHGRAYYRPSEDAVHMPKQSAFTGSAEYYSVLFHELVHSTGHSKRLDRGIERPDGFGSEGYSKEELIAEMGAAFLMAESGFEYVEQTLENTAAYIQGWLRALRNDKRLLVSAGSAAQKAAEYILNTASATESGEDEN